MKMNVIKYAEGKMNTIIIILIGILFASLGQVFWKIGMNSIGAIDKFSIPGIISMFLNPVVLLGLFMYGLSTVFWLIALSRKDLSFVYPFISLTFIIVLFLSYFILKEQIGTARIIGTIIIIIGLMVVVKG
jgi:uncharacterized membrane protein